MSYLRIVKPVAINDKKMNLDAWIDHLTRQHPVEIDMGLTRVSKAAGFLNLTDLGKTKIITVAGTNGKGTTCAFLESILLNAGYSVGVYSSPHLLKFNERVRINGDDIDDSDLIAAFEMIRAHRRDISLTFFEYATLAGLYIFKQKQVDVVLLEVGLGGRLDATNIIDADISVLTSIGLDHQAFLGDTRESVGIEKAGVCREHRPAIIGEPDVPEKVMLKLRDIGSRTSYAGKQFFGTEQENNWVFSGVRQIDGLAYPSLPLQNAVTAIQTVLHLDDSIADEAIRQGIQTANIPGRMELVATDPSVFLDVAHNPQSARYLKTQLAKYQNKRIYALCGMLIDKDIQKVIDELSDSISAWNFVTLDVDRGATAEEIRQFFNGSAQTGCFDSVEAGWNDLKTKNNRGRCGNCVRLILHCSGL